MRFRITVRGGDVELRGYITGGGEILNALSLAMDPFGVVMASAVDDDYDPFKEAPRGN